MTVQGPFLKLDLRNEQQFHPSAVLHLGLFSARFKNRHSSAAEQRFYGTIRVAEASPENVPKTLF